MFSIVMILKKETAAEDFYKKTKEICISLFISF